MVTDSCVRVHVWRVVWTAFAIFSFFKLMEQFLIKRGVVRRCVWCGVVCRLTEALRSMLRCRTLLFVCVVAPGSGWTGCTWR